MLETMQQVVVALADSVDLSVLDMLATWSQVANHPQLIKRYVDEWGVIVKVPARVVVWHLVLHLLQSWFLNITPVDRGIDGGFIIITIIIIVSVISILWH